MPLKLEADVQWRDWYVMETDMETKKSTWKRQKMQTLVMLFTLYKYCVYTIFYICTTNPPGNSPLEEMFNIITQAVISNTVYSL